MIGIVTKNLDEGELQRLILSEENKSERPITNFIMEIKKPIIKPKYTVNHLSEIWGFFHPLVSTCLDSTIRTLSMPGPTERYYYIWDLEWTKISPKTYDSLREIYAHPKIKLIARNNEHRVLLQQLWGANVVGMIDNFNLAQIFELINEQGNRKRNL